MQICWVTGYPVNRESGYPEIRDVMIDTDTGAHDTGHPDTR